MSTADMKGLTVFTGSAHPALAREICAVLGIPLGRTECRRFADGEAYCQILENVRAQTSSSSSRPVHRPTRT